MASDLRFNTRIRIGIAVAATLAGAFHFSSAAGGGGPSELPGGLTPQGPGAINHPVNVTPSERVRIPGGWPLNDDGQITCWTCHASIPDAALGDDKGLRGGLDGEIETQFCATCHRVPMAENQRPHWMALGQAHLGTEDEKADSQSSLDSVSRRCASCHDGVAAMDLGNHARGLSSGSYMGDSRRDHPVGVPYKPTGSKGTTGLRAAGLLPAEVLLPDGQVTCISCHNLYADGPGLLSVPIEGSRLCFSCHDMD